MAPSLVMVDIRAHPGGLEPVMKLLLYWAAEFGTRRDGSPHPAPAPIRLSQ
jgi:hypothetical protein